MPSPTEKNIRLWPPAGTPSLGGLNKWIHVWPYASLEERDRVRAEAAKDPNWPAPTREMLVRQEVKILSPASFSPMH